MPRIFSADDLLNGSFDVTIPVYLDTTSWKDFEAWTGQNLKSLKTALSQGLVFWIFADELSHTEPELHRLYLKDINLKNQLIEEDTEDTNEEGAIEDIEPILSIEEQLATNLGVKFHREKLPRADIAYNAFLNEVKDIYFYDVANRNRCDRHAEFTFLTRQAARNDNKLRVLSAQSAFQRLVNAEIFLFPVGLPKPTLPANFDIFTELQIHPQLRKTVEVDFRNGDYSKVVFQAVNAFRDFVRGITLLPDDGGELMKKALNVDYTGSGNKMQVANLPPLLLNNIAVGDLASHSEVGEQDGFYRFAQGIFKAIRNPSAHTTATDPFIQSRFHDENTAIKVLCFLSLICERIDQPKRFRP